MPYTPNGVTFDGKHSYTDFGLWLSERPDLGSPEPKLNTIEISGADGIIDLTEANAGDVKFSNRTMKFTFAAMVDVADQESFKATIMNALHGKRISQIILDEDPDWVYNGRARVEFKNITPWKLKCQITIDAAPYAMKAADTTVWLSPAGASVETTQVLRGIDDSGEWPNSDISLGTAEFPSGIDFAGADRIILAWDVRVVGVGPFVVTVYDTLGTQGQYTIPDADIILGRYEITYLALDQDQIVLNKVYRITVSNIPYCSLYSEHDVYQFRAYNARKNVMPIFFWNDARYNSVDLTINEKDYSVKRDAYTSGLVLVSGWNEIYIDPDQFTYGYPSYFYIRYTEGRL